MSRHCPKPSRNIRRRTGQDLTRELLNDKGLPLRVQDMRRTHHPLRHAHHGRPASTRTRAAQEKAARAATAKAAPTRLSAPRCYPATTRVTRRPPRESGRPLEASGNLVAGVSGNATDTGTNHKETAETCWKNLCENPPLCFCDLRIKDTVDFKTNCRRRRQTRRRSARPRSGGQPRTEIQP